MAVTRPTVGHIDAAGTPAFSQPYAYAAGTAVGATVNVTLPEGSYLKTVSAVAQTAAGSVKIGAGDTVTVPIGKEFTQEVGCGIIGAAGGTTIAFTNCDSYFVDWLG